MPVNDFGHAYNHIFYVRQLVLNQCFVCNWHIPTMLHAHLLTKHRRSWCSIIRPAYLEKERVIVYSLPLSLAAILLGVSTNIMRPNIMYIEDDTYGLSLVIEKLKVDFNLELVSNCDSALEVIKSGAAIDLILLDIWLPDGDACPRDNNTQLTGLIFAKYLLEVMKLDIPIVCYSSAKERRIIDAANKAGVKETVPKTGISDYSRLQQAILRNITNGA